MIEGTPRTPHTRTYRYPNGKLAIIEVDDHGIVQISEELLDHFLRGNGLIEQDTPAGGVRYTLPEHDHR